MKIDRSHEDHRPSAGLSGQGFVFGPAACPVANANLRGAASVPLVLSAEREARLTLPRDATIYLEDAPADHWYEVVSGVVSTAKLSPRGRRQVVAFHFPGEVFGFDERGGRHMLTAAAAAFGETLVVRRRRATLEAIAAVDARIALWQRDVVRRELEQTQARLLLIGQFQATQRVAALLEEFSNRLARHGDRPSGDHAAPSPDLFDMPVSSRDIADYLGLTLETFSRGQHVLCRKGVVALPACRQVRILDRAALRREAAGYHAVPAPSVDRWVEHAARSGLSGSPAT